MSASIKFTRQEIDDILSCISIAKRSGAHSDSPKFWKAVDKLKDKLWWHWRRFK